jgi:hypothetical protein
MIALDRPLEGDSDSLARIDATVAALRQDPLAGADDRQRLQRAGILGHADALAGQLRAAVEIVQEGSVAGEEGTLRGAAARPLPPARRAHAPGESRRGALRLCRLGHRRG